MDMIREAVLDIIRVGLNGDSASLRRLARKLLNRLPASEEGDFRASLADILTAEYRTVSPFREAVPEVIDGRGTASSLLRIEESPDDERPILSERDARRVKDLVTEREKADALLRVGLEPVKSLLLTGPPGVGKTMTAHYIASRLNLPIVAVDLAGVMSSLLGKTAQNLRKVINTARDAPCVLLLDEFDALAKRRDDPTDVGELKRIVNVLLLELEDWPAQGLLIAATNHPELLDRAIWRRFDQELQLGLPDEPARIQILAAKLGQHGVTVDDKTLRLAATATEAYSGSELERLAREVVRTTIVKPNADPVLVLRQAAFRSFGERHSSGQDMRARVCDIAYNQIGMSQREIGEMLDVSHVTVGRALKKLSESA